MRPAVEGKSPVIALKSVVFPAPLAPRMPRRSPAPTVRSTLSRATSAPKVRHTPSRTRAWAAPARFNLSASAMGLTLRGSTRSRAARIVAADRAQGHEIGLRHAEGLVHVVHDLDDLVVEMAVIGLGDFGQEDAGHRVA